MPQKPTQPAAGTGSSEQVQARIAATYQLLARSHQHAKQAMAQVRYIDRLLHSTSQRSDAAEQAEATRSAHLVEVLEHEVAAHERAVALHETAAELQEESGWPERAAAARAHAAHARELARRPGRNWPDTRRERRRPRSKLTSCASACRPLVAETMRWTSTSPLTPTGSRPSGRAWRS